MADLKLGDIAPDFTAETTEGTVSYHEWLGDSWGILFSHPADFTPVCTTELGTAAKYKPEFDKRNVKMMAISVDDIDSHHEWVKDINETQNCVMNFPIIADPNKEIADLYGMIHPKASGTATVRSVYIVGPDKTLKLLLTYPASTGRNFDELLRVIDSLQLTANQQLATPANWNHGDKVVISPSVSDEDADKRFPGYEKVKPYLRLTKV
ncbi:peroxiredoxin [Fulvivirga sediminis]|uniref:Peroxiredoxin n=1 Tax=Fulvivirga sediminis TaxID=2803949 RepID=A0A937F1X3_9BACT|nr:peroxiredoxin [Fulvivirga sediminis]MBL3654782.1 peroxiredoxin [Fulvivirga sediminis]